LGSTTALLSACDVVIADTGFIAIRKFCDLEGGFTDGPAPGNWDFEFRKNVYAHLFT
jgi:hypothetical protein